MEDGILYHTFSIYILHLSFCYSKQANYQLLETVLTMGSSLGFYSTWPFPTPVALTYSRGAAGYDEQADMRFISAHKK